MTTGPVCVRARSGVSRRAHTCLLLCVCWFFGGGGCEPAHRRAGVKAGCRPWCLRGSSSLAYHCCVTHPIRIVLPHPRRPPPHPRRSPPPSSSSPTHRWDGYLLHAPPFFPPVTPVCRPPSSSPALSFPSPAGVAVALPTAPSPPAVPRPTAVSPASSGHAAAARVADGAVLGRGGRRGRKRKVPTRGRRTVARGGGGGGCGLGRRRASAPSLVAPPPTHTPRARWQWCHPTTRGGDGCGGG